MELNLNWRNETSALGEEIQYEIRPLRVWAFQELMAFWEDKPRRSKEGHAGVAVSPAESLKLMEIAQRIFTDHVRHLRGVTIHDEAGKRDASLEDICEESPLIELAGEILGKLIAASDISAAEEKN